MKGIFRKLLFFLCLFVFLYSLVKIGVYTYEDRVLANKNDVAQEFIKIEAPSNLGEIEIPTTKPNAKPIVPDIDVLPPATQLPEEPDVEQEVDIYKDLKIDIEVDWDGFKKKAKHLTGWIYIPDTNINFPLLHHKTDTQYYLRKDYEGKYNSGGSIFLNKDTDINAKNVIIYGHNMRADIMFHRIRYYREQDFADKHKYIYIVTEKETRIYQVFSARYTYYWTDAYTHEFGVPENLSFMDYINQGKNASMIRTNVREIVESDSIITLSTCSGREKTERLLVHAVLLTKY